VAPVYANMARIEPDEQVEVPEEPVQPEVLVAEAKQPSAASAVSVAQAALNLAASIARAAAQEVGYSADSVVPPILPEPTDLKVIFPLLALEMLVPLSVVKHKKENAMRNNFDSFGPRLRVFVVAFLCTVHRALELNPESWVLVADGRNLHLALACGWIFTKYGQAGLQTDIAFRLVRKGEALPHIGDGKCGCSTLIEHNPNIFIVSTPMINVGRFSASVVKKCLAVVPPGDRTIFGLRDIQMVKRDTAMPSPHPHRAASPNAQPRTAMRTPSPAPGSTSDGSPLRTPRGSPGSPMSFHSPVSMSISSSAGSYSSSNSSSSCAHGRTMTSSFSQVPSTPGMACPLEDAPPPEMLQAFDDLLGWIASRAKRHGLRVCQRRPTPPSMPSFTSWNKLTM